MSHPNQLTFVKACAQMMARQYSSGKVVEIGSYAVNGSIREFFDWAEEYTGVDLANGPGVDEVSSGHEFGESNAYDVAISCEVFEHNPYWLETFLNMIRITKEGGTVLFTCATHGRVEHGTVRTNPEASPGTSSIGWSYYQNLVEKDFINRVDISKHFSIYCFFMAKSSCDLYFVGVKRSYASVNDHQTNWLQQGMLVLEQLVKEINAQPRIPPSKKYSLIKVLIMLPMIMAAKILPDRLYQDFHNSYMRNIAWIKQHLLGNDS